MFRVGLLYNPVFKSENGPHANLLADGRLQCFAQTLRFGTELATCTTYEIEHSLEQTRNRFCGHLRRNARSQPQCQCRSPSYASVDG